MAIPLFHTVLSWFLKKRVHDIELFIKYPHEVQSEQLLNLIKYAKNTDMGKKFGFDDIKTYDDFSSRVPVRKYEEIVSMIDACRKGKQNIFWPSNIKWFAKSSGTTNDKSKFIPISNESLENCHFKGGKDMLSLYFSNNEKSSLFQGKALRLGGSRALYEDNNTYFGDLSAIIIDNLPLWAEYVSAPSHKVSLMDEWEVKLEAIVEETLNEDIRSMAGVPSWMMVLLQKILSKSGKSNILEIWPNMEVYFHGGVNFIPYKNQYKKLFPSSEMNYIEIYNASEGFFGVQDRLNSDDMLLMLDYGIFYEFIAMSCYGKQNEIIIGLNDVKIGEQYAIIITTNSGLWRYHIGDTIKFTCLSPYRIKITGRTKHFINVFGEEIVIENTDSALEIVCNKYKLEMIDYTAAPIFMKGNEKGGHEWLIEFKNPPKNIKDFSEDLDKTLQSINSDYQAKRYKNMTLNCLKVNVAKKDLFYSWLKKKGKIGGQHKVPRLSNNRNLIEELLDYEAALS
ncbi:MAG: GH3 auxin-responsive promoter family protein [Bacteroidota bacterium]|nr:GH3 auxin-responsive promoter family protein [Bacteroidota bacterium]